MIERILKKRLREAARQFLVVKVTGPRQSGKDIVGLYQF